MYTYELGMYVVYFTYYNDVSMYTHARVCVCVRYLKLFYSKLPSFWFKTKVRLK